jgi:ABC-type uncharacterized transport system substrate-binding protein
MEWVATLPGRRVLAAALLAAALAGPRPVAATHTQVLAVTAAHSPAHAEVIAALRAKLDDAPERRVALRVTTVAELAQDTADGGDRPAPDLILTVGTEAAAAVLHGQPAAPVYCSLLPQAAYSPLLAGGERAPTSSALYLDQPVARQLRLIRLALPRLARIGVVLGPESRQGEAALRRAAAGLGLTLRVEVIHEERHLVGALHRVMDEADVLLAVPDPLVFNRHTAQSVLLATYRLGKPVVGYSRAYVGAGALLAVYSTPAQIGRQLGEWLLARPEPAGRLPPPRHPRYFSVDVNERVAHSLGYEIVPEEELARRLLEADKEDGP